MLSLKEVSRLFSEGATGFKQVSMNVEKGEIIAILGTSGCGKSTLLRVLSGLDQNYDGTIKVNEVTIQAVQKEIGMIFQEPRLMPWLNVEENIGFGLRNKKEKENVRTFIQSVGLEGFEGHYPKDLSGGMAQRVAIARALVTVPKILLLDEPFSALDAFTKMKLQDLLLSIWSKFQSTLIVVTHDIEEALYLADRVIILRGQPGEIHQERNVDIPKPRERESESFMKLKREILGLLDLSKHSI